MPKRSDNPSPLPLRRPELFEELMRNPDLTPQSPPPPQPPPAASGPSRGDRKGPQPPPDEPEPSDDE